MKGRAGEHGGNNPVTFGLNQTLPNGSCGVCGSGFVTAPQHFPTGFESKMALGLRVTSGRGAERMRMARIVAYAAFTLLLAA